MAKRNYFERMMPRRTLGGFYSSSLSSLNDTNLYNIGPRKFRQNFFYDNTLSTGKSYSSSNSCASKSNSVNTSTNTTPMPSPPLIENDRDNTDSNGQVSLGLIGSSLKCDDCQTHDGLFQCCHCNQRLCIRCCNKHYKKVTVEIERLHELSDRLMAKIVHTKNDLERQKNETLEQCHKWRVDTINSINKAHTLIVQTIHSEYEVLAKDYDLFVQKEMANLNVEQNELVRIKKGTMGSLLTSPSVTNHESTNAIDEIRKRIENFAKNIDETGKCLFQVELPKFDIDDRLRVESRFGDTTRCTSATWPNENPTSINVPDEINLNFDDGEQFIDNNNDQGSENESQMTSSSPLPSPTSEELINDENQIKSTPSSRYALSVDRDIELQQQKCYRAAAFRDERYDSAYGTAPSSPSASESQHQDLYSSTMSLPHSPKQKTSTSTKFGSHSFENNRRHTHSFDRGSSTSFESRSDPDEDIYRSVKHVQMKKCEDGSIEGVAVQVEQSQKTLGSMKQSRTCVEACGIRRRTVIIPPQSPSANSSRLSDDRPWLYYRTSSSPSFIQ